MSLSESAEEPGWAAAGAYSLWLDTNAPVYGGGPSTLDSHFEGSDRVPHTLTVAPATALVYSREEKLQ